jgi:hypothetical protein
LVQVVVPLQVQIKVEGARLSRAAVEVAHEVEILGAGTRAVRLEVTVPFSFWFEDPLEVEVEVAR